jgi:hypothetical protein
LGDLDVDGDVDAADRAVLLGTLRKCTGDEGFNPVADLDNDGCVTFMDYRLWYIDYKNYLSQ